MTPRLRAALLAGILLFSSFQLAAQCFAVAIDSVVGAPGDIVCVPVRAKGFNQIGSFQFSLKWDKAVLEFQKMQNLSLPGHSTVDFNYVPPHFVLVVWADPTGLCITKPDGTALWELCFKIIGPVGSGGIITAGGEPFPPGAGGAEAYGCMPPNIDLWNQNCVMPGYADVNGVSALEDANQPERLLLFPNPTRGTTLVSSGEKLSGAALLRVFDMFGRLVLEKKTDALASETPLEIPAGALSTKGFYQVLLQTEKGQRSAMLVVE